MAVIDAVSAIAKKRYADSYAADVFRPHPLLALFTPGMKYVPTWRQRVSYRWYRVRAWVARKVLRVDLGVDE